MAICVWYYLIHATVCVCVWGAIITSWDTKDGLTVKL